MTVKDFIPIGDAKITTEKEVKPKPSISELTTVEVPGKPTPATFLESPKEKIKLRKKARKKAEPSGISSVKRDGILIITEKPQAAQKIAYALGNAKKYTDNGASYFEVQRDEKKIYVASAVGHLFGLNYKKGQKGWPVFEIEWQPSFNKKTAAFTRKYYELLKKLSHRATEYILAADYDIEGELIGWNIIRFICKKDNAKRMKFSTLTAPELRKAFENPQPHLNWGNAYAGETRHILDWLYGINLSRALMSAIKQTGSFKVLSIGRVQGPTLKIIVEREKEIEQFKPEPYWQVFATVQSLRLKHKEDIFNKDELKKFENLKEGMAETINSRENIIPPYPFDLTTLQREAYNLYKINPSQTLAIAQKLYLDGLISYPRTSSQKIPDAIEPKKILKRLEENFPEAKQATRQSPVEGKKSDPAHPSIYPSGEFAELSGQELKLYSLIAKRFIAAFSPDAIVDQKRINLISNDLRFTTSGITIVEKGWTSFYPTRMEETHLPDINGKVMIDKIEIEEKETQPPRRYTPASLISTLERKNLGTKCLTENTLIKINSNKKVHNEQISEIFNDLSKNSPTINENNIEITKNNGKACFSFNGGKEIKSSFELVSKRKLEKNEKLYKIKYKDGSTIEVTEDHPVLIYNNKACKYIPAKNIYHGMKSISSIKYPDKWGGIICTWEDFIEKCNEKVQLYGESSEISEKRREREMSQKVYGQIHSILQSSISNYEKSKSVPLYIIRELNLKKPRFITAHNKNSIIENPFPLKISSSLTRVLANLIGDCSIDSKKIKRENCYDFRYHNTNIDLINRFVEDIKTIFSHDLETRIAKPVEGHPPIYYVKLPAVIGRIISILFEEVIHKNVIKIPREFYPEFIGSLFDDEGHAMKSEPKIFISNTNFNMLEDTKKMLESLEINSMLDKNQFKLYIRGRNNVQKFLETIPIVSIKKKQRIIEMLSKFYKYGKERSSQQKQLLILSELNSSEENELTNKELSEKLKFEMPTLRHHLNLLIKQGYIKRNIKGIKAYPRKKITYKLIKPVQETFFKYIDEEIISPDFITKTVESVRTINYNGFVYDITNNLENPNFILGNGVVVHNSTRSMIVDILFDRGYLEGTSIKATPLGIKLIDSLQKYSSIIIDENLTRQIEEQIEKLQDGASNLKEKEDEIISKAKNIINDISKEFKSKEREIGLELIKGIEIQREVQNQSNILMECPTCKKGNLRIMYNKKARRYFVACSNYPNCTQTYTLPPDSLIKKAETQCEADKFPKLLAIRKGRRPWEFCFNPECPLKNQTN